MKISQRGINLVKEFEGCHTSAYKCPAGVWTIGYGHTGGVQPGYVITVAQAEELLRGDMADSEKKVAKYDSTYHWNQNQFDALTSFAFNIGNIDQLTANGTRGLSTIADKLLLYNKAAGKVLAGLERRRKAEQALFLEPMPKLTGKWKQSVNGDWWYLYPDGSFPAGRWAEINGKYYLFDADGWMLTGWQEWEEQYYYLHPDGSMATGFLVIDNAAYYFHSDGRMAVQGEQIDVTLHPSCTGALY